MGGSDLLRRDQEVCLCVAMCQTCQYIDSTSQKQRKKKKKEEEGEVGRREGETAGHLDD